MESDATETTDGSEHVKILNLETVVIFEDCTFPDYEFLDTMLNTVLQASNNLEMPLCHANTLANKRQTQPGNPHPVKQTAQKRETGLPQPFRTHHLDSTT